MTTITHTDYQAHVDQLHASRYMNTPMEVAIETQTVCNAACEFCPYPSLERLLSDNGFEPFHYAISMRYRASMDILSWKV